MKTVKVCCNELEYEMYFQVQNKVADVLWLYYIHIMYSICLLPLFILTPLGESMQRD